MGVTDDGSITTTAKAVIDKFGTIDILIKNIGYGYQRAIEGSVKKEVNAQFGNNVFGWCIFYTPRSAVADASTAPGICNSHHLGSRPG